MGRGLRRQDKVRIPKTSSCDFTLADSADSNFNTGRLKKAVSKSFPKKLIKSEELDEPECDNSDENCINIDWEQIETKDLENKCKLHHLKKQNSNNQYYVYPMDIWFLIGLYIWPESVKSFAQICQATHIVTHSAIFWRNLYSRFYSKSAEMPSELRLECMGKLDGLRTRVVRALNWLYEPYILKQKKIVACDFDTDYLAGKQCVLTWYKQQGKYCHLYFKFIRKGSNCILRQISDAKKISRYAKFEIDLFHNSEENACILDVMTESYIAVPMAIGHWLSHCNLTVGHQFQNCVKMYFNSQQYISPKNKDNPSVLIKLDPVIDVKLYKWWNQNYQ